MKNKRFDIRFGFEAEKEYNELDNSILHIVNPAIDELQYRADEVGKALSNFNNTKLAGTREIKLRSSGIRIIYQITNEVVHILQIVYILAIEKRSDNIVFKLASQRLKALRKMEKRQLTSHIKQSKKWNLLNRK